jgi:serine/threonine-protein kinase
MTLESGSHLGPYEIVAPLGAGGMGEVYRARDTRLEREVAVKVLPDDVAADERARARFQREAKAVAALSHPNIMAIYDIGSEQGVSFAVMELLRGRTLYDRITGTALPWRKAVEMALPIAEGLAAAHARGIVHRDLKPQNVFVTSDGVVKILDFGLARTREPSSVDTEAATLTSPRETMPGTVMGTPGYMSPEQVRGDAADERSDIFAFGCVLYEMVTGHCAFDGQSSAEIMAAILKDEPPEIAEAARDVPPELDRVIRHCLEKDPEQRFQSARDLAFALKAIVTDSGVSRAYPIPVAPRSRAPLVIALSCLVVVVVAVALVALNVAGWRDRLSGSGAPVATQPIRSLAVLPFENLTGDHEQEYFADGMTDALISDLGQISALRVISRTSAMQYKGAAKSMPEIAQELNVEGVVEGSLQRAGETVLIRAKLFHAPRDEQLWGNSYERELRDILALQGDVARAIAHEIQVRLTPQEEARFTGARPVNPRAYEAYLKGRYYWNQTTREGLARSVLYFQDAIDGDPDYALAHAGLGDAYALLGFNGHRPTRETIPQARTAVLKALELDGTLAEAHATLGLIKWLYDWDQEGAEREFLRALELDPGYAVTRRWYAYFLAYSERYDEAIHEIRLAQQTDPVSLTINTVAGIVFFHAGQYDQAMEECRKAIELDPDFPYAHGMLGVVYVQKGMADEGVAEAERAVSLAQGHLEVTGMLGRIYAQAGREAEARKTLNELRDISSQRFVPPMSFAQIYAALGEVDLALEWLEKGYQERDANLSGLRANPVYDALRGDPRFDDLLRRVGLDPQRGPQPVARPPAGKIMLAVLPFENLGGDPGQEFFSDGMTEEMIAQLGRLQPKKLGVIARTSAMRYKDTDKRADQIGRELGVHYLLEGSVRRSGDRVRVTAQLIQVSDQTHLWAERYDNRAIEDVFDVQSDVAARIASSLALELLPGERVRLAAARPVSPEAYEAYLLGRHYWNKRTEEGLKRSLDYFRQAIDRQPAYALAYAGLADAYAVLGFNGFISPHETVPQVKAAAARALELDSMIGEAHASLALVRWLYDWDSPGAEAEFRRALELSPGYATGHMWYSIFLLCNGRFDESLVEIGRARELDPLSPMIHTAPGVVDYMSRRYDEAIAVAREALELDVDFVYALWLLGQVYKQKAMYDQAIAALQRAVAVPGSPPEVLAALGHAYGVAGRDDEAREVLDGFRRRSERSWVPPSYLATVHLGLGEKDQAFEWLDKACDDHEGGLYYLNVDPIYDPLRGDPRFDDLLRRLKLEPARKSQPTAGRRDGKIMLAVLPLENLSPDPEQEYFSDGMTEEMITQLGRLRPEKLGVIARTSAMRYKDSDKPVDWIGRELGVEYILEGSVRRAGGRVRIAAKLVQVSDETQLWGDAYEREVSDVFAVQTDVAESVAEALAVELLSEERPRAVAATANPAAHDAYLRGRHHWNQRTEEGVRKAIAFFEQAIEHDPEYALAYAGLADCYIVLAEYGATSAREVFPAAKQAAHKALEINDLLAEAHTSLAGIKSDYDWDWEGAERAYRRALELDPGCAAARQWYAEFLTQMGRHDEALAEIQRALEIDPLSLIINSVKAALLYYAGQHEEALEQARRTLELDPDFPVVHYFLGEVYEALGRYEEAIAELQRAATLAGGGPKWRSRLAHTYAVAGREREARRLLDEVTSPSPGGFVSPYTVAAVYGALGDTDEAFRWLERAVEERDVRLRWLSVEPQFPSLRPDPRFDDLLRRMGFEPEKPR